MNKQTIRDTIRAKNLKITADQRLLCEVDIARQIENSTPFDSAEYIALFIALDDEVSTINTINKWHAMGKKILLPVIENGGSMQFHRYSPDAIKVGRFNIPAPDTTNPRCPIVTPDKINLIIVPGVAFTKSGKRLGRGGGFYDRYLSSTNLHATTIGICYSHQIIDNIPTEPHDKTMQKVIYAR